MSSRALILASVLLFVSGCDYSQKKPQVLLEPSVQPLSVAVWSSPAHSKTGLSSS